MRDLTNRRIAPGVVTPHTLARERKIVPAAPCAKCGTTGGFVTYNSCYPMRWDGKKLGFTSKLCHSCYIPLAREYQNKNKVVFREDDHPVVQQAAAKVIEDFTEMIAASVETDRKRRAREGRRIGDLTPREACKVIRRQWRRTFGRAVAQGAHP